MRIYALLLLALPPIVAAACGGGPEPVTPTNPTDSSSAAPAGSASAAASSTSSSIPEALPTVWSGDMPIKQQAAFMKANVIPRMSKVFQGHDATKYANFGCVTCHGPNSENPHKFLPKLKINSPDGMKELMAKKPEVVKFMHEQVEPEMAHAMGVQSFDMKTMQGFGCKGCHATE